MTAQETKEIIGAMLTGTMHEDEILMQLSAWDLEGISFGQLVGGAQAMREAMVSVSLEGSPVDTCGTGGSGLKTINTSTLVAFLVAAAGAQVAKHGNRSASGNCGCFDVLEGLGINIELSPQQEQVVYSELGMVFLYAKLHHPAMRFVAGARKQFGKKTLFNLLGPLCSPASVTHQMIGTGNHADADLLIAALKALGSEQALVVTGEDGLDEVTVCGTTRVVEVQSGQTTMFEPESLGIEIAEPHLIEGGTAEENVEVVRWLASGAGQDAQRNLILINAAHALALTHLAENVQEGFDIAMETLGSGEVLKLIDRYIECSNDVR